MKTSVRGATELARLHGIELTYEAMDGSRQRAEPEAVHALLVALGANMQDGAREALRARREQLDLLGIQPVTVAWDGALPAVRVRLPHAGRERASVEFRLESGEVITHSCDAEPAAARPRGGWSATHVLQLGRRLPHGYHRLHIETAGATLETFIIAAPRHAYVPPDAREWGLFFPLYAACSADGWGVGSYTDLQRAAAWIGELGGGFVSTLPLLAAFLDAPFEPSPYSPASRLFWNELFVDVGAIPGSAATAAVPHDERAACATGDFVDYPRTAALKRRQLEQALRQSRDDPQAMAGLEQFAAAHARVSDYARFRAVVDRRREGWPVWPERLRNGTIQENDFAPDDYEYHLFAQWQADSQLAKVAATSDAGGARLYLDMPLGVNADSYDVWRFRDLFAAGVSAGAPPDPLFTGGQNWGFRPLNPHALRASGYGYLIETLRHHFRHARMLRLDHVMSLYRLYWIPEDMPATKGVYVRYPEDELFAVLVMESARHRAIVVGEDLGTVPPAVRRAMDRHHVQRMHVVQFEADPDGSPPVKEPGEPVVASLNTHDMPTFAGFWRGSEIDDQLDLGLIDEAGHEEAQQRRATLRRRLSRSLGAGGEIGDALARQRLLERLADSTARYVLINLEDLWGEDRPQNVPGTSSERPNWKRRMRRPLDEIMQDTAIRRTLAALTERRRASHQPAK